MHWLLGRVPVLSLLLAAMTFLPATAQALEAAEAPEPSEAEVPSGGGSAAGESGCTSTPVSCEGASTPLPGQTVAVDAGTTGVQDGCLTGRIVTTGTGQTHSDYLPFCPDIDGDGIADPPANGTAIPVERRPPTHQDIIDEGVCPTIPTPAIGVNPREWGITGYHTWLWDTTTPGPQRDDGNIRGYYVECTITPTTWTFDVNEPTAERYGHQQQYTADNHGTETETTDIQHMWSTKGTYPITLTVQWDRVSNYGQDSDIGTNTRPYQVNEILIQPAPNPQ